jgi:uncharacterized protein YjbJ (UPF0337 family)
MVEASPTANHERRRFTANSLLSGNRHVLCSFKRWEEPMKNRDEFKGKAEELKGKAKQAWGDLTDDERLRNEGVEDEAAGDVEQTLGRGRRKVGEAIEDLGKNIKR